MIVAFIFGAIPFPAGARYEMPNVTRLWMWERVKERLSRMYGDEDKVPAAGYAKRGLELHKPLGGERWIIQDSLFYFAPDKMKREFEGIWPRSAKNEGRGTGRSAGVPPASGSAGRDWRHWQSAKNEEKKFRQDQQDYPDKKEIETASSATLHGPRTTLLLLSTVHGPRATCRL